MRYHADAHGSPLEMGDAAEPKAALTMRLENEISFLLIFTVYTQGNLQNIGFLIEQRFQTDFQ